jgi:hypothetical protein
MLMGVAMSITMGMVAIALAAGMRMAGGPVGMAMRVFAMSGNGADAEDSHVVSFGVSGGVQLWKSLE